MGAFLRKNRGWLIVLLIAIMAVSAFVYLRKSRSNTLSQFQTAQIERGNLVATIGATGTVRAKQSTVLAWQTNGAVDTVNVKVGDNIPADFVMAFLNKTSLPQNIILAEADLASAQKSLDDLENSDTAHAQSVIDLREAQKAYDRAVNYRKELNGKINLKKIIYKTFGDRQVPILKEYRGYADDTVKAKADEDAALKKAKLDDAQRKFDSLNAGNLVDIKAAQARVDAAQATLNLALIVAPFPGIVTEAHPLPGDQVSAGATAFRLDDLSGLYVDVEVSEVDINNVSLGQAATLSFDAILSKTYHGEVVEVAKVGNTVNGVVNFTVTVELTDADDLVKPGMTAGVNIVVKELKDVLLVPNRAVRFVDSKRAVYLLVDGQSVKKEISLGSSSDSASVVVGGDIKVGDVIILNPPVEFQGGPGRGPDGGGPGG